MIAEVFLDNDVLSKKSQNSIIIKSQQDFKFHHSLHILGPLLYKDVSTGNAIYRLIGVTSWGFGCGRKDYPGYYAAVYPQLDWIYETMKKTTKCPNQVNKNELARCSSSVTKDNCTLRSIAILLWLWQLSKQE